MISKIIDNIILLVNSQCYDYEVYSYTQGRALRGVWEFTPPPKV